MSAIRHPNIVQYLGTFRDTDTHLPVLLMELMDDSLTHFLESSTQPILYHIQVNICHDVTLALSFLHSNNIVHRDLSSNNVLLIGNIRAKVTDFGMARLCDINPQATRFTNTMCPGTDVYMPPEAVQDKPVYTEKIDSFSFGVIIVQILTRQFPEPGDRVERVELNHPGLRAGIVLVPIPEVERRQNHISQVDPNHTLLPITLDCLKDKDSERPSSHQLCERVADLKGMPKYIDSAGTDKDDVIQSQAVQISSKEQENQQLRQQLQQERDQANRQLEERERQLQQESSEALRRTRTQLQEKERQLGRVNLQLEASEQAVAQFERRTAELERQLCQREQQKIEASSRGQELTSFKLRWREGKRAPCKIYRHCDAVVNGNTVYVRNQALMDIYAYDVTSDCWSQLPNAVHDHGSIIVINGWLTTVGGYSSPSYSNELFSLISGRRWTKKFPPMPTKRSDTTAVCPGSTLIVTGGKKDHGVVSIVEVLNTETHQWSTAADLPEPMCNASATVCGDQLYLLGGMNKFWSYTKSVYTCSVSALLQSCVLSSLEAKFTSLETAHKASVWNRVADSPDTCSTCEYLHGRLLAIGGKIDMWKATTAVYMYNSTTNSWHIISHMITGRMLCFTAVLPDNQLMVVGGHTDDTIEVASICN